MPFKYRLTWVQHAKCWRKRYDKKTYYLKTKVNGKRDRPGYEAAFREWERLKAYIDGLGPSPYTLTGVLIPESQVVNPTPLYVPPMPESQSVQPAISNSGNGKKREPATVAPAHSTNDPVWIQSTGLGPYLHPEQVVTNANGTR